MNKLKIAYTLLLIAIFVFSASIFLKIKHREEYQQKVVLAQETRKVLSHLMIDLSQAHENSFQDLPADGQWHSRIAFIKDHQGAMEYLIKDGHLLCIYNTKAYLVANHIAAFRVRREEQAPDILEIQIKAQDKVSLLSNLRIRVRE